MAPVSRPDGFDPVGLSEIAAIIGESRQFARYLMARYNAPEAVPLTASESWMKVWQRAETSAYLRSVTFSRRRRGKPPGTGLLPAVPQESPVPLAGEFDPVGLHGIMLMRDPPITEEHADWLMRRRGAPEPVRLARMKVWRRSEAEPYVRAHFARVEAGEWFDPGRPRGRDGRWAKEPPPEPDAEALELAEWISSGRAREIRRAAGLTCLAVAGEVGVSESTVGRWENGQKFPGPVHAAAYHALLTRLAEGTGS